MKNGPTDALAESLVQLGASRDEVPCSGAANSLRFNRVLRTRKPSIILREREPRFGRRNHRNHRNHKSAIRCDKARSGAMRARILYNINVRESRFVIS